MEFNHTSLENPAHDERIQNRLYRCSPAEYPELTEELYLTGCHSILVDTLSEVERDMTRHHLGDIYVTDAKYRLMACVDERAKPWTVTGVYTVWHLALEHDDARMNYGVWANGILAETCSIHFMRRWANMTMI